MNASRRGGAAVLLLATVAWGCEQPQSRPDRARDRVLGVESLLQADRRFDSLTAERGVEAWVSFFAEDGVMLVEEVGEVRGREDIRALMEPVLGGGGQGLRWEPLRGEVSASGDLGYTTGVYRAPGPDTGAAPVRGRYVTVWRRVGDEWKVVMDLGVAPVPAEDAAPASGEAPDTGGG